MTQIWLESIPLVKSQCKLNYIDCFVNYVNCYSPRSRYSPPPPPRLHSRPRLRLHQSVSLLLHQDLFPSWWTVAASAVERSWWPASVSGTQPTSTSAHWTAATSSSATARQWRGTANRIWLRCTTGSDWPKEWTAYRDCLSECVWSWRRTEPSQVRQTAGFISPSWNFQGKHESVV